MTSWDCVSHKSTRHHSNWALKQYRNLNEHGFQTATCFSDHLTYRFFFWGGGHMAGYEDSTWQLHPTPPLKPAKTCQVFAHPLPFNVIPHIDSFQSNGYTKVWITGPALWITGIVVCRQSQKRCRKMMKTMESSLKFNGDLPKKTFFFGCGFTFLSFQG